MRRCRKHQEKLVIASNKAKEEVRKAFKEYSEELAEWNKLSPEERAKAEKPQAPTKAEIAKYKQECLDACGMDPHEAHKLKVHKARKAAAEEITSEQEKLNKGKKPRLVSREKREAIIKSHLDKAGPAPIFAPTRAEKRKKVESFNPYRGKKPGSPEPKQEEPKPEEPKQEEPKQEEQQQQPNQDVKDNGSNG